ncbi:hypothetical protein C0J52_14850 [Blattella germanica]|nr:hypothetical protein C0J52_14850 [Blattella germanica]
MPVSSFSGGQMDHASKVKVLDNHLKLQSLILIFPGKRDDLQSPSSRLMLGQPSVGGTGCFSILYKLPHIKDLGF